MIIMIEDIVGQGEETSQFEKVSFISLALEYVFLCIWT